jgi:ankyrin repeat protein
MHSTDALPLPPHPDIDQYRTLAKELLLAAKTGESERIEAWAHAWMTRLYELSGADEEHPHRVRGIARQAHEFAMYWTGERTVRNVPPPRATLAHVQFIIARLQGFATWAELTRYIESVTRRDSDVARFEAAVDAIVSGDNATLRRMLLEHPDLVRARSSRAHHATLLHYVSANGVEGYRQKTPSNIVEIAKLLLAAGADVNAGAHCYGEDDDTLSLTATSAHPANAGVMIPMLDLLVAAGANIHRTSNGWTNVRACLANGQPEAAAWLADHGAEVGFADVAGLGRLDRVRHYLAPNGALLNGATERQLNEAWKSATWYGRIDVARYFMDAGIDPNLANKTGATALHRAAHTGAVELAELLIARGANVNAKDKEFDASPLDWAQHARSQGEDGDDREALDRMIALLRSKLPSPP